MFAKVLIIAHLSGRCRRSLDISVIVCVKFGDVHYGCVASQDGHLRVPLHLSRQYDLRCPEFDSDTPGNVLINLNAHLGDEAEAKCITVNPLQPDMMAVGANDPYARLYDRRMLTCRRMRLPGQPSR